MLCNCFSDRIIQFPNSSVIILLIIFFGSQFTGDSKEFYDGKEAWKEKFLNEITRRDEARTLVDNSRFRIVGLPFFNEKISKEVVKEKLIEINKNTVYRIDNTYAERLVVEDEAKEDYDL